ncbi:hypothetical protein ZWY2020_028208 [Hordeum vulgare]|nr:hypothetical protein ZWY2020_028208 [Hordeum vulgare]
MTRRTTAGGRRAATSPGGIEDDDDDDDDGVGKVIEQPSTQIEQPSTSVLSPSKKYKRAPDRGACPMAKKKRGHAAVVQPSTHAPSRAPAPAKNTRSKERLLPNPARNTRSKALKF